MELLPAPCIYELATWAQEHACEFVRREVLPESIGGRSGAAAE